MYDLQLFQFMITFLVFIIISLSMNQLSLNSVKKDKPRLSKKNSFIQSKRQNGWTNRAQILCETLHGPREDLWIIEILKFWVLFKKNHFYRNTKIQKLKVKLQTDAQSWICTNPSLTGIVIIISIIIIILTF